MRGKEAPDSTDFELLGPAIPVEIQLRSIDSPALLTWVELA